ncbi:MAG: hypothetical protein RI967_2453 [Planctomycetota bacterium]
MERTSSMVDGGDSRGGARMASCGSACAGSVARASGSRWSRAFVAVAAVAAVFVLAVAAPARASGAGGETPVFHDGKSVVRVAVTDARSLRAALAIADDVLTHRLAVGPVDLVVPAERVALLAKAGLAPEVLVADLGPVLRSDFARRAARGADGGVAGGGFFADFRTNDEINAWLDGLATAHPGLVSVFTVGTSLEGRPIRGVRITAAPAGSPGVLFNGTQHAREWGATMTTLAVADALVAGHGVDARVTALLSRAWIDVIPVVNPDGYEYAWTVDRLWRKNRRDNGDGTFGVDLNRNWAFEWGGGGASTVTSDPTYRGPAPFSEPESAAMRDYFTAHPDLAGHIDFHAYSQLVLHPWGYTTVPPANNAAFQALGDEMRDSIARETGAAYVAGPIASTLYIASGSAVDHAWGAHGVPSWTIEVRDRGAYGFVMPPSEIAPCVAENIAAALDLADATVDAAVIRLAGAAPSVAAAGEPVAFEAGVHALRGALVDGGVRLRARTAPSQAFDSIPARALGGGRFAFTLPAAACGATTEWYLEADAAVETGNGATVRTARLPRDPAAIYATASVDTTGVFADTFETALGWTVGAAGDTATSGLWTRADPVGTLAQPENDSLDDGLRCYITGNGLPGQGIGVADVDGGATTLLSPVFDGSDPGTWISYERWYSNDRGSAPNADSMPVSVSTDGGATWTILEDVVENANAWVRREFRVADFVASGPSLQVRFIARDLGAGSIVEAGVDDFRVVVRACPAVTADLDGDGVVGGADLAVLLSGWGGSGAADLDGSGTVDAADLAALLAAWGAAQGG